MYYYENKYSPEEWVSILIASYNTENKYITDCLTSIRQQKGNFGIEIVWINDGSNEEYSRFLLDILDEMRTLNHTKIVYKKQETNRGLVHCLYEGVLLCSNEIICRMDSDDFMMDTRIQKQLDFMKSTPSCVLCGTNIQPFMIKDGSIIYLKSSEHPPIYTWKQYIIDKKDWILNHPTLCFRKGSILQIGNYNPNFQYPFEDLDLELRVLKHYGFVCNLQEVLLYYRIHPEQITHKNRYNNDIKIKKLEYIENYIRNQ